MREGKDQKDRTRNGNNTMTALQLVAAAGSLGLTLFVNIFAGVLIGRFIDSCFETNPFGLIGFSLLGAVTGFWSLYRKARNLDEKIK